MSLHHANEVYEVMMASLIDQNRSLFPKSNPFVPENFEPRYNSASLRTDPEAKVTFCYALVFSQNLRKRVKVEDSYDIADQRMLARNGIKPPRKMFSADQQ